MYWRSKDPTTVLLRTTWIPVLKWAFNFGYKTSRKLVLSALKIRLLRDESVKVFRPFIHVLGISLRDWSPRRPLQWRHNELDRVSNYQPHDCLLNRLFRRNQKTSKLRVTGLCVGNSPGPVNSPHTCPVTRKMFPFDDVIMSMKTCCKQYLTYIWTFKDPNVVLLNTSLEKGVKLGLQFV